MKTKLLFLFAALFCVAGLLTAQVSAYTFTQMSGSYGAPSTGSMVGTPLQDDDVNTVSLPFTFTFNGTPYNSVNVCSNGYISFNALGGSEYTPISDPSTSDLISPFGNDLLMTTLASGVITIGSNSITGCSSVIGFSIGDVLFDVNGDFSSNPTIVNIVGNTVVLNQTALNNVPAFDLINFSSGIFNSVSGVAPNQVCEFEFRKFSRFFMPDESVSFKIRLYETSNKVEFVYGDVISGMDNSPVEVGLKGSSSSDFNSRRATMPVLWANSIASSAITDVCDFDAFNVPVNGQIYQWTPLTCTVPVLAVAPSSTITCSGTSVTLTASGASTFTWVNGPSSAQNTVSPLSTTSYTLMGANSTCTSSIIYTHNVAANPTLVPSATVGICVGQSATLSVSGATSYSWNGVAGSASKVVSPASTTTYVVTGSNGTCSASASIVQNVSLCTGLASNNLASEFSVYPNPFTNNLSFSNQNAGQVEVRISDALGRIIYSGQMGTDEKIEVNTSSYPSGLYLVSLKGQSGSETRRLVKP